MAAPAIAATVASLLRTSCIGTPWLRNEPAGSGRPPRIHSGEAESSLRASFPGSAGAGVRHRAPRPVIRRMRRERGAAYGRAMTNTTDTPTIVLVHGGFADASFWVPVMRAALERPAGARSGQPAAWPGARRRVP